MLVVSMEVHDVIFMPSVHSDMHGLAIGACSLKLWKTVFWIDLSSVIWKQIHRQTITAKQRRNVLKDRRNKCRLNHHHISVSLSPVCVVFKYTCAAAENLAKLTYLYKCARPGWAHDCRHKNTWPICRLTSRYTAARTGCLSCTSRRLDKNSH